MCNKKFYIINCQSSILIFFLRVLINCIIVAYMRYLKSQWKLYKPITSNIVFIFHRGTNLLGLQIMCHLFLDQMLATNPSNARRSETTSWFCCAGDFRDCISLRLPFYFIFFYQNTTDNIHKRRRRSHVKQKYICQFLYCKNKQFLIQTNSTNRK